MRRPARPLIEGAWPQPGTTGPLANADKFGHIRQVNDRSGLRTVRETAARHQKTGYQTLINQILADAETTQTRRRRSGGAQH